jgi:hypothetical protein
LYQQILISVQPSGEIPPQPPLKKGGEQDLSASTHEGEQNSSSSTQQGEQGLFPSTHEGEQEQPPLVKGGLGGIDSDDSPEQMELRLSGLVVKREGKLSVYNRIYEAVFNLNWVEKELAKLRPYSEAFKEWLASDCKDKSRLLRGQALQDALAWAANKSLSNQDYQFLARCQDQVKQQAEEQIAQAKQRLERVQAQLNQAEVALNEAKKATELERAGSSALKQFESGQEIEALLLALQSGQELKELVKDGRPPEKYPTLSPVSALQTIVNNIRERNQFKGHQDVVNSVSFSPDGKTLATAGGDGTARLWNLSGQQLAQFPGHQGWVRSVSFSPDGKTLATAGDDGTARLWNLSGQQLAQFPAHQGSVKSVSFSPDGKTLATAGDNGTVKLWRVNGLDELLLRGCNWLKDYLATHPEALEKLKACQSQ